MSGSERRRASASDSDSYGPQLAGAGTSRAREAIGAGRDERLSGAAQPHVKVRTAATDEVDALLEMYAWLFEPPGYRPPQWDPCAARQRVVAAIADERSTILVAETPDGGLVGVISAYLDLESIRFGLRCWVEDLAVGPSWRSRGIGKMLLDAAKAWAKARGATHLELDTGLARVDAQRFYDREAPRSKGYTYSWGL